MPREEQDSCHCQFAIGAQQTSVMGDEISRRASVAPDTGGATLSAMRFVPAVLALGALLVGCGGDDAARPLGPATFSDASVDVGKGTTSTDASTDALLADAGCMTCVGASMPTWQLQDFEPKSPGYGKTYGLEAFKGKVTVVALLASW